MHQFYKKNNKGSTLLFVLLMLFAMVSVGFVLASLVFREINLLRHIDDSVKAFYAADSGLERALDVVRQDYQQKKGYSETITKARAVTSDIEPNISYNLTATADQTQEAIFPFLDIGEQVSGAQIEMYDLDNSSANIDARSVRILWNESVGCAATQSRLEMTFVGVNTVTTTTGTISLEGQEILKTVIRDCGSGITAYRCSLVSNDVPSPEGFILRVKPVNCALENVEVKFFNQIDGNGDIVNIPSRYQLVSMGKGKYSQRKVTATAKWLPSAYQLVDFVLFSVERVMK